MTLSLEEKEKRKEERRLKKYNETHRINDVGKVEKLCSICNEWVIADIKHFYASKSNKMDGLHPECILCALEKQKQYQLEHCQEQKERHRKWHIKNRKSEIHKKTKYNKEHFEYKQKYFKEWRKSDKGRKIMCGHSRKYSNKAHKISKREWESCKNYFTDEKGQPICAYCGMTISEHRKIYNQDFHKEHLYYDGRSDLKNCIPSCKRCNTSKHQYSFNDWYNVNNLIYTYERYHKICQWIHFDCKKYIVKKKPRNKS